MSTARGSPPIFLGVHRGGCGGVVYSFVGVVACFGITTDADQHLYLDTADAELMKGKRILIVDDVISTGASLYAVEQLVEAAGGIVCGKMTVLAEGDAQKRDDIIYLEKLPLFTKDGSVIDEG